jgi:hypothetical protein
MSEVTNNIFAKATRLDLKFNGVNLAPNATQLQRRISNVTVSDVWNLSLEDLDVLAQKLDVQIKAAPAKSFISGTAQGNSDLEHLQLQFDIVYTIIQQKVVERDASRKRAETVAQKELARDVLAARKADALKDLSLEELEAFVNS